VTRAAIKIENLSKCYRLGETHEQTFSDQLVRIARSMVGRGRANSLRQAKDFWALRDISLNIMEGEAVGIVGGNGAGKSTLLKILSRITLPTEGRALVRGRLSSLLEVGTGFHPELTGRENVFLNGAILGMRNAEVARKFDEIVDFAGVEQFIDTPVKRYSSGMYVRLAFAVAAHLEPDVLIIDEVLAVGDADFQKRCLGKMGDVAKEGRTVIFVSHNMAAVQKLCSRAAWLSSGQLLAEGDPAQVIRQYLDASGTAADGGSDTKPGFLYYSESAAAHAKARVVSLQLLDSRSTPVSEVATWEPMVFRVGFEVAERFRSFSVVLQIATLDGAVLILTSTAPDNTVEFGVDSGRYLIDCAFDRCLLSAGEYLIGVGLAIPSVEYVFREDALCRMHVLPKDVLGSGLPPTTKRYFVASKHAWTRPDRAPEGGRT